MDWEIFKAYLADEIGVDKGTIERSSSLKNDLGVDSFAKVSTIILFEELTGRSFTEAEIIAVRSAGQLWRLINGEGVCSAAGSEDTMILTG